MNISYKETIKRFYLTLFLFLIIFPSMAFAGIPNAPSGIAGASQGDFMQIVPALMKSVSTWIIPVMYLASGICLIASLIYKYMEAKEQNKWGGFGATLIIGIILFIIVLIILNMVQTAMK